MQTTLLGLAIAIILALIAALVGPYFVTWSEHRAFFETEASRLIGLQVRVNGPINLSILPFPSVKLAGIEIGPAGEASRLKARSLGMEFGLGPLMRGEIRAVEMKLSGPEFSVGLNSLGYIDWPNSTLAADTLAIDKLNIEDGRVTLTDAASNSKLVLDQIWFSDDVNDRNCFEMVEGPAHLGGPDEIVEDQGFQALQILGAELQPFLECREIGRAHV